jgi:hypothetical protein
MDRSSSRLDRSCSGRPGAVFCGRKFRQQPFTRCGPRSAGQVPRCRADDSSSARVRLPGCEVVDHNAYAAVGLAASEGTCKFHRQDAGNCAVGKIAMAVARWVIAGSTGPGDAAEVAAQEQHGQRDHPQPEQQVGRQPDPAGPADAAECEPRSACNGQPSHPAGQESGRRDDPATADGEAAKGYPAVGECRLSLIEGAARTRTDAHEGIS